MELLGLFDNNGNYLNKSIVRGDKNFNDGENIKLVTIWIENNGKYLIQKCSKEKGGEYAVTGGHVTFGNSSPEQAVIEIKEELDLDIKMGNLTFCGNIYKPHAIFDVYILNNFYFDIDKCKLQESEVESIQWLTKSEIEQLIENNAFRKSSEMQYHKFIK